MPAPKRNAGKKSSAYLSEQSLKIIDRLVSETGKTRSAIINDALQFYDMQTAIKDLMREVLREELKKR